MVCDHCGSDAHVTFNQDCPKYCTVCVASETTETRSRVRHAYVPSAVQTVIMRVNALSAIRAKRIMSRTSARASSVRIARNTDTRRSSVPKSPRLRAMHAVPVRINRQGRSIVLSTNVRRANQSRRPRTKRPQPALPTSTMRVMQTYRPHNGRVHVSTMLRC